MAFRSKGKINYFINVLNVFQFNVLYFFQIKIEIQPNQITSH